MKKFIKENWFKFVVGISILFFVLLILFFVLLILLNILAHVPFWQDYAFWNVVVLTLTLCWLIKYTRATEKIAENQMIPAVDVNMFYEKSVGKTYFWFLNASSIPAFISIKIKIHNTNEERKILELRIPPHHPHYRQFRKTATSFDFLEGKNDVRVTLSITITSAFNKNHAKLKFTKSYKFNALDSQWDEITWAYPDPEFPS